MKNNSQQRGLLAGIGALVAAAALALGTATTAVAAPQPVPTEGTVHITKIAQPGVLGEPADGVDKGPQTGGIPGVTYEAYLVPGIDLGTNAGQDLARQATPADAWADVQAATAPAAPVPAGTQQTDADGVANFANLPRGLYLFRETAVPAGVTAAPDFLVAVPLTDPRSESDWLTDIFVYPKNARIQADKTVENATDYRLGDSVTWTITAAVPRVQNAGGTGFQAPDAFVIHDTLDDAELSTTVDDVTVATPAGLVKGTDYTVALNTTVAGQTTVEIVFSATGLTKLATAVNADANAVVTATIDTVVLATGVIVNEAEVFPNAAALADDEPLVTDEAEIRYGSFAVQKQSSDAALNAVGAAGDPLAGAEFRVYLTRAAAEAAGSDYLAPSTNPAGLWTTDATGAILIEGLRDSDFADGAPQTAADAGNPASAAYQTYWLVEVKALDGHQLLAEPVEIVVTQGTGGATADLVLTNQKTAGGFELPLTGGTGTTALTVGGLVILGLVLVAALRRRGQNA
ncbi:MAG: SpaH/EbpB family LPXTG-anchored major pilin [Arachnia sp.]